MFRSLIIDYKNTRTELCKIGAKYDTDKSSQRQNTNSSRHSHPYTCFYHSLFKSARNHPLKICELGILHGASLKMWREYFSNVQIFGYEYDLEYISNFRKHEYDNVPSHIIPHIRPIQLSQIDVTSRDNISQQMNNMGVTYDLIIEDTTHQMNDQINVVLEATKYLNPGGILIVEDIFLKYDENEYKTKLEPILDEYQDIYFVTLDHQNRISTGWNNDKLLVMVKKGERVFKNQNKLTIVTPCSRPENIHKLYQSINFDYVNRWYIIYDATKVAQNPHVFENNHKIREFVYTGVGISGNPQRNHALDLIASDNTDTYIYYLDDDNIIHPGLYGLLDIIDTNRIYTFDISGNTSIKDGNHPVANQIDISQFLAHYSLIGENRWIPHLYNSDGHYIELCCYLNTDKWNYVHDILAYYNYLATP